MSYKAFYTIRWSHIRKAPKLIQKNMKAIAQMDLEEKAKYVATYML